MLRREDASARCRQPENPVVHPPLRVALSEEMWYNSPYKMAFSADKQ